MLTCNTKLQAGDRCDLCNEGIMRVTASRKIGDKELTDIECDKCSHGHGFMTPFKPT